VRFIDYLTENPGILLHQPPPGPSPEPGEDEAAFDAPTLGGAGRPDDPGAAGQGPPGRVRPGTGPPRGPRVDPGGAAAAEPVQPAPKPAATIAPPPDAPEAPTPASPELPGPPAGPGPIRARADARAPGHRREQPVTRRSSELPGQAGPSAHFDAATTTATICSNPPVIELGPPATGGRVPTGRPGQPLLVDVHPAQVEPAGAPPSAAVTVTSNGRPRPRQPLRNAAVPPVEAHAPGPGAPASHTLNPASLSREGGDAGDGIRTGHPDYAPVPGTSPARTDHPRGETPQVTPAPRASATLAPPSPAAAPGATPSPSTGLGNGPLG